MPPTARVSRTVSLPDRLRLERYARAPELGPRILFFSGGSALAPLSREMIRFTHNSLHVITAFDSGGSSASLREAFGMLAVGDLRNRLMALTDRSVSGKPAIVELFAYRFPHDADPEQLERRLVSMVHGDDPLVAAVTDPMRKIIRNHLGYFRQAKPAEFDLRGASIGNLVLVGGFLNNHRHIDPVIYLFTKLAEAKGVVRPVLSQHLHLVASLGDGHQVVGQHNLTGREAPPLTSPIEKLWLVPADHPDRPVRPEIRSKMRQLIQSAELICYPMGSFWTSLVATLLPRGVGQAVRGTPCPKVYIPNTLGDKEMVGMSVASSVETLLHYLRQGCDQIATTDQLLNLVVIDSANGRYPGGPPQVEAIRKLGIEVVDAPLVTPQSAPLLDPGKVLEILLSLV